jgi:CHAT domain-containing protein
LPQFLQHLAIYEFRLARYAASDEHFRQALDAAEAIPDWRSAGRIWDNWGQSFLERGELQAAERCLLASFRIRALRRDPESGRLPLHLARLEFLRGNLDAALAMSNRALRVARAGLSNYPVGDVYLLQGELLERRGDLAGALAAYREALRWTRRWRLQILPADSLQMVAASRLDQLLAGYLRCAFRQPVRTGEPGLAAETLEAVEENRAASLRMASLRGEDYERLFPAEYWEILASLHRAEAQVLAGQASAERDRLEARALEIEARLGLASEASAQKPIVRADSFRKSLPADEAVHVFWLGQQEGYVWLVTREGLDFRRVPDRETLARAAQRFRSEILSGSRTDTGREIFVNLFGELFPAASTKRFWTLVLDGPMFELPLAALPAASSGSPLAARHAISVTPGIFHLGQSGTGQETVSLEFQGIADPVYNLADSRIPAQPARLPDGAAARLNRLPGTAREAAAAANLWLKANPAGRVKLLTGLDATGKRLFEASASRPAVLHLATHVVANEDRTLLALGLMGVPERAGPPELIGAEQIAARRTSPDLVVMSGCASGRGRPIGGAGLQGLARAWILAGSRGVLASQWPLPDDSGELMQAFYRLLPGGSRHADRRTWAVALQGAQLEMLRGGGWRSEPSYWAAYLLTARN